MSAHSKRASVLERSTWILDIFFEGATRLTLQDVVSTTGLPRSTTFRLLTQLVELGWLQRDEYGYGYGLGAKILDVGTRIADHGQLRKSAHSVLTELQHVTGGFVHLGVLEQSGWVHFLDRIGVASETTFASSVGARHPLEHTSTGKAILAALPEDEASRILGRRETVRRARLEVLRQEIRSIRLGGTVATLNAIINGIQVRSVAAAIMGPDGPVGAVAIGGDNVSPTRSGELVRMAAHIVSERMYPSLENTSADETAPPNVVYL